MVSQEIKDLIDLVQTHRGLALLEFSHKTQTDPGPFRKLDLVKPSFFSKFLYCFSHTFHD